MSCTMLSHANEEARIVCEKVDGKDETSDGHLRQGLRGTHAPFYQQYNKFGKHLLVL
jgi:hypothetical protein